LLLTTTDSTISSQRGTRVKNTSQSYQQRPYSQKYWRTFNAVGRQRSAQNLIKAGLITFLFNERQECPSNGQHLCCIFRACSPHDAARSRIGDTTQISLAEQ